MSALTTGRSTVRLALLCSDVTDSFSVTRFQGTEELNRPYGLQIDLVAADEGTDTTGLLGRDVMLTVDRGDEYSRVFWGVVDAVTIHSDAETRQASTITLVPALQALQLTQNSRIFQDKTTLEIVSLLLNEGLAPYRRTFDITGVDSNRFLKRDYCVQYRETTLAFLHRLLEEDGIGYYFRHAPEGPEELVLFDDNRALSRVRTADGGPVAFGAVTRAWGPIEPVLEFAPESKLTSSSIVTHDYDWARMSMSSLRAKAEVDGNPGRGAHEVYQHGLDRHLTIHQDDELAALMFATVSAASVATAPLGALDYQVTALPGALVGNFRHSNLDDRVRIGAQQLARDAERATGLSLVRSFSPGHSFELVGHPTLGADGEYFITKVMHFSEPDANTAADERTAAQESAQTYHNRFACLPLAVPWRPERITPKPRIHGVQTAKVSGPAGMEIHTDPHGRIKVRFPWDRSGEDLTGNYTCWMRVAQLWAGHGAPGFSFIPRIGMEVVVSFIEGDPDRPVVTGCVYNATNPTPQLLPIQATKSVIRTRTIPHGFGYNELSFEDAMGMERVHIRAQRDLDELVLNNHVTDVRANQSVVVGADQHHHVGRHQRLDVGGNRDVTVTGEDSQRSLSNHHHYVNGSALLEVGQSYHLDVQGGSYSVEVEGGEYQVISRGPVFIEQAEERSILMSDDEQEKGITIKSKESTVHVSEDKIELTIGGSSILMTAAFIQINGKMFPAAGGGGSAT